MKKVLFDCDNTMGMSGRDVDDGLALLYLLGREDVELKGLTTTYGNSSLDEVFQNTKTMFKELNIENIPLIKGAKSAEFRISDAAEFLAKEAAKSPGEITLLATGALTNLYGAYELDNNFFNNLKDIVLMGGVTETLMINGVNLDELNFSCDPLATYKVLNSNCNVSILTGHICLQAFFGEEELTKLRSKRGHRIYKFITKNIEPWYAFVEKSFGIWGFYNWDIVSAVYVTNPELFEDKYEYVVSSEANLNKGYLKIDNNKDGAAKINIPANIKNREEFNKIIFEAWENVR
jgi:purine nucleosidase